MQQEDIPNFDRADYLRTSTSATLDPIAGYREYGSAEEQGRNHTAYLRSIIFGIAAAMAGCALYAGVQMATGWTIGYVALAVGYMVGRAMKLGSGGRGGRRYQIAAALLTYAAVALAAIPVEMHQDLAHLTNLGTLVVLGLASPFFELSRGLGGIIGLFILFIGIRAAWKITTGTEAGSPSPGRPTLG